MNEIASGYFANKSPSKDLKLIWIISFGSMVLAYPIYSLMVFYVGLDRMVVANYFALHITIAYWLGITAAFLPLPGLQHWRAMERIKYVCLPFMMASYATHLSWELVWLFMHESIGQARDEIWAYTWWAYMDGGDIRYLNPAPSFLMMEITSVFNGSVGLTGLFLLFRSGFQNHRGTLLCMATAVVHVVLTWSYYGTEIITDFESVGPNLFFDLWIKFILLNGPWLVFPWLVLYWGYNLLGEQMGRVPDR